MLSREAKAWRFVALSKWLLLLGGSTFIDGFSKVIAPNGHPLVSWRPEGVWTKVSADLHNFQGIFKIPMWSIKMNHPVYLFQIIYFSWGKVTSLWIAIMIWIVETKQKMIRIISWCMIWRSDLYDSFYNQTVQRSKLQMHATVYCYLLLPLFSLKWLAFPM